MTETDICKMALDLLNENPALNNIQSDGTPNAEWFRRNFAITRDALLRRATWTFALKRASLAADTVDYASEWDYSYTIPADAIRVLPLTYDGKYEGTEILHQIDGGRIMTSHGGPRPIMYVSRHVNYENWPADLIEALSAALALKMAHWMTGKAGMAQMMEKKYQDALQSAWLTNALEGTPERASANAYVDARWL